MNKKCYQRPEIELIKYNNTDVLTYSPQIPTEEDELPRI